jgi:hypothetical protein
VHVAAHQVIMQFGNCFISLTSYFSLFYVCKILIIPKKISAKCRQVWVNAETKLEGAARILFACNGRKPRTAAV